MRLREVPLILSVSLLACSSSAPAASNGEGDAGVSSDAALVADGPPADASLDVDPQLRAAAKMSCDAEAQATCTRMSTCYPSMLAATFGDMATCVVRESLACMPTVLAPGSLTQPSDIDECTNVLVTADCASVFYNRALPSLCQPRVGGLGTDAPCGVAAQCQSGVCKHDGACGVCSPRVEESGACTQTEECDASLVCAGGICVIPEDVGLRCDDTHPCLSGRTCVGGTCQSTKAGDSCAPATPPTASTCDATAGLWCDSTTKTCQPWKSTASGACGVVSGNLVVCSGGGDCAGGSCVPPAKDGESCTNAPCLAPAICDPVQHTCVLVTESTCL